MPRCVISWADVPTALLTLLSPGWFASFPHSADVSHLPGALGQVVVPAWLYIDGLLVLPLRPARITPRNGEAGGSAVFWEDRTGGWCGDVHRLTELRERERGDRGHGSLGKAGQAAVR